LRKQKFREKLFLSFQFSVRAHPLVPIDQSQLTHDALKSAGRNVQMATLEGDDHYLELAASRIRVLTETERFLAANIGTGATETK
jgi:hypothetical protein